MKIPFFLSLLIYAQPYLSNGYTSFQLNGVQLETIKNSDLYLPATDQTFLDAQHYYKLVESLDQMVYKEPQNAQLDVSGNIVPEQLGMKLNRTAFIAKLYEHIYAKRTTNIEVPIIPIYPKVDSELLATIREKKIGQYITYFNSRNKTRSHNILLATEAIDNQVVFPGETFSFNGVVGRRTKEKGYLPAPVIVKGELSEGIGGGICQVSSTLFNAVDNAGLKIVQRYSHSKRVPYVPEGRDATVSWYGPDFRFQNKYNQPILLRAKIYQGKLMVTVYSSEAVNFLPKQIQRATNKLPEEINVEEVNYQ